MKHSEFADYLCEQLSPIGPVSAKRMFGGYGLFLDGLMFGLIASDILYLKTDSQTKPQFDEQELQPFRYSKGEKEVALSYSQAPDEAIEDMALLCQWANEAYGAALRSANNKKKHKK